MAERPTGGERKSHYEKKKVHSLIFPSVSLIVVDHIWHNQGAGTPPGLCLTTFTSITFVDHIDLIQTGTPILGLNLFVHKEQQTAMSLTFVDHLKLLPVHTQQWVSFIR